jgi:hypothetical protein
MVGRLRRGMLEVDLVGGHILRIQSSKSSSLNLVVSRKSSYHPLALPSSARLHLPEPLGYPINLTAFKRSTDGTLGDQVATAGPYSDTLSGVCIAKTKLDAGIYLFVPSTFDKGLQGAWTMNVWSDVSLSAERAK